ncbi:MAG: DoxX-like family [Actinomycetota bacterium]
MWSKERFALRLAAMQVVDIVVTQVSPRYGDAHLAHLGVPPRLRAVLPAIKTATTVALLVGVRRPRVRSVTGAGLVAYYAAAVTFHVRSNDPWTEIAPAAAFGLVASAVV